LPELQRCHFGQKHTLEAPGRSQVALRLPPVVDEINLDRAGYPLQALTGCVRSYRGEFLKLGRCCWCVQCLSAHKSASFGCQLITRIVCPN